MQPDKSAKLIPANPATFASPWWGPIGYCDVDRVVFRREPLNRQTFAPESLTARVDIVPAQTGIGRDYIDYAVAKGCKGIIVEGFGRGNIPPMMVEGIKDATDKGVVVVITTRTHGGRPYRSTPIRVRSLTAETKGQSVEEKPQLQKLVLN